MNCKSNGTGAANVANCKLRGLGKFARGRFNTLVGLRSQQVDFVRQT